MLKRSVEEKSVEEKDLLKIKDGKKTSVRVWGHDVYMKSIVSTRRILLNLHKRRALCEGGNGASKMVHSIA